MIIKNNELQKLKATKNKLYLLYGENKGFKDQFIKENLAYNFNENIFKYEEKEILDDYNNFISSILNKSFFENKKLLIISNVTDKILKLVEELISSNISDIEIVFNSGILDKKSKLRNFFEKEKKTICIPFYSDENKTLSFMANTFFKEKKFPFHKKQLIF